MIKLPETVRFTDHTDQYLLTRKIFLSADIDECTVDDVCQKLLLLEDFDSTKPITLMIDSYGGGVYEALAITSVMDSLECPVHTTVLGKAMSAAFVIAICGEPGHRLISPMGTMMMHEPSSVDIGKVTELEVSLEESKRLRKILWDIMEEKTKLSKRKLNQIKKDDTYFSALEAIEQGILDGFVGGR